jgi:predicted aspartyl protease
MGMFKVRVEVGNPTVPERCFVEDFWVDTGALYSFIPEDRLREIDVIPLHTRALIMADGRRTQRPFGEARFTIAALGETMTCPVVFAPPGSLYLLGATALEVFGVDADPTAGTLKPISAIIGGFLASRLPS